MPVALATEQPFRNLSNQVGKLMDQMSKGYYNFAPGEIWAPNVNLYETDTTYLVCVDLAGVDKDKIDITVDRHMLKLHGRRIVPVPAGGSTPAQPDAAQAPPQPETHHPHQRMRVHLMEIDHGSFSREVELPMDVKEDQIQAQYRNGLLWIELPKKQ